MNSYQRYYLRNREELTRKMRDNYDATAKHDYYEANKEHIKEKMKEIYQRNKALRMKAMVEEAAAKASDDATKAFLQKMLQSEAYRTMGLKAIRTLVQVVE